MVNTHSMFLPRLAPPFFIVREFDATWAHMRLRLSIEIMAIRLENGMHTGYMTASA